MVNPYIQLHPNDNLLVALEDLESGRKISFHGTDIRLIDDIPAKHKFTIMELKEGDSLILYGVLVAKAVKNIPQGGLISVNNVIYAEEKYSIGKPEFHWEPPNISAWEKKFFEGYYRADGRVGTANYWLVLPLVFCENHYIELLKSVLAESLGYSEKKGPSIDIQPLIHSYKAGESIGKILEYDIFKTDNELLNDRIFRNVDGIKFLTHDGGCGGTRYDAEVLCALLAGYITHPNVGGATVLSLGCQNAQISLLRQKIEKIDNSFSKPLLLIEQQKYSSEKDFLNEAIKGTFSGLIEANKAERKPAPLSKLILGLECGGSDGFSGISANPTLGYVSDLLVALGGIAILSEFPELNGVEQELLNRCVNRKLAEKFAGIMKSYSERASLVGSGFDNNPSPGNIRDGLITHTMKSAGAAKKGGTSPVTDVLDYSEQAVAPGLNLLCTPGNDVESTTGIAGSGANIIVFTTGLGTPTGNPVCPVIKVSSNTALYERMNDIIDFDTGSILQGTESIKSLGEKLFDYIIEVASGRADPAAVRSGHDNFIPWKRGISL
jgi:altronate hydrolase